jgi:hypothetical protein
VVAPVRAQQTDALIVLVGDDAPAVDLDLATHEHVSVSFYMDGSVKAAVDLKP